MKNTIDFAAINKRFEDQALAFVQKRGLEAECLTYLLETSPGIASDIFWELSHGHLGQSSLLPVMARMLVLDPFDNPGIFGDFAEFIGWSYDDLFSLIVDGIEPERTA